MGVARQFLSSWRGRFDVQHPDSRRMGVDGACGCAMGCHRFGHSGYGALLLHVAMVVP